MTQYIVSIPNPDVEGNPKTLRSDDDSLIARWVKAEDRPGFSVYNCPNPLKPSATTHGKDSIAAIVQIFVDTDFKDIIETPNQVDEKLVNLLLPASEIVDSGHGRHIKYNLKEPIPTDDPAFARACAVQAILIEYLAGDPQVRPWSLLRRTGTTNSKHNPHVPCRVMHHGGAVDLTELEELCDIVKGTALLTYKEKQRNNGRDPISNTGDAPDERGPVNVEAEIASICDGATANAVQCRIIPALLRRAMHPAEVLDYVVEATMARAKQCSLAWTREAEVTAVRRRIVSSYNNLLLKDCDPADGVIPVWLPGEFHEAWIARLEAGQHPVFSFNRGGFYIRKQQGDGKKEAAAKPDVETDTSSGADDHGAKVEQPRRLGNNKILELHRFEPFDVALLPPRVWLYGKHYQRRTVSMTAGPGGMGKSSLDLVEAIAMATCRNLLGEQPEERLRVWYHNGEDPLDEIKRRVAAICQYYKIPQEELPGYLWITSGNEFPLRVARGYTNLEINTVLVRQISAAISNNQIDQATFDPLVTLHSVSEVDSGKMDAVVRVFAGIADENDAGVELSHHMRKPAAGTNNDYDVHDIRGVAAITDAVRAARVLNRMNEKDAESAGCSEIERLSRFRVDRAKGNYSPAQAATWRQFISIELANGDDVGVVAPWNFPGQGEQTPEKTAADQKAEHVFLQLLDKFLARGINVSATPSKFAEEREATVAKMSKAALKAAMARLLDAGRVRTEPVGRGDRPSQHRLVPWQGAPQ
jgi:RecA-family ATPase